MKGHSIWKIAATILITICVIAAVVLLAHFVLPTKFCWLSEDQLHGCIWLVIGLGLISFFMMLNWDAGSNW